MNTYNIVCLLLLEFPQITYNHAELKGQITNYKPAIQITSISIKSDSIPLSGEFGHIVRVIGVPFLALNCDRCTAESTTANFKHTQRKFSYIGDC